MNSPQQNRGMEIVTPLGADKLLLYRMKALDQLSRPFEISLDLLSADHNIALEDVLGQSATIGVDLQSGGKRILNGLVSRFS